VYVNLYDDDDERQILPYATAVTACTSMELSEAFVNSTIMFAIA